MYQYPFLHNIFIGTYNQYNLPNDIRIFNYRNLLFNVKGKLSSKLLKNNKINYLWNNNGYFLIGM